MTDMPINGTAHEAAGEFPLLLRVKLELGSVRVEFDGRYDDVVPCMMKFLGWVRGDEAGLDDVDDDAPEGEA